MRPRKTQTGVHVGRRDVRAPCNLLPDRGRLLKIDAAAAFSLLAFSIDAGNGASGLPIVVCSNLLPHQHTCSLLSARVKSAAMSEWETILRKKPQKPHGGLKPEQAVNRARREGVPIETQQKWGGGQNKQHVTTKNTAKLDRETEELKHETIPLSLGKLIQQGRQAKGWSQKDLATRCNEKPQVINDYEAGRGIPNQAIIGKIERALGVKLRGKDVGRNVPPVKK